VLNPWIGNLHGDLINKCLHKWGIKSDEIDCIASHGQTVFHAPFRLHGLEQFPNATLQIGDGDHIAFKTGIITFSDFRQKHCAAGGEGAPLAVYGDYLIFSKKGKDRILLNMGGISNYTYLSADLDATKVYATDTGPGNTLMDSLMRNHFDKPFDLDGLVAEKGQVNNSLLVELKNNPFFKESFPKTTGPELFNLDYLNSAIARSGNYHVSVQDQMATLNRFTAETIADALYGLLKDKQNVEVIMSGGGVHNKLVVNHLKSLLKGVNFLKTDDIGISGDAKEAVLFAVLANESLVGGTTDFGKRIGVPSVSMGKVSFPE
jgi:anhydro-N-acetylmuramic acid kinase